MPPQKLLLKFYFCLSHFNLSREKKIGLERYISVVDCDVTEVTPNNEIFKCMDCELAKYIRKTEVSAKKYICKEKGEFLKKDIT